MIEPAKTKQQLQQLCRPFECNVIFCIKSRPSRVLTTCYTIRIYDTKSHRYNIIIWDRPVCVFLYSLRYDIILLNSICRCPGKWSILIHCIFCRFINAFQVWKIVILLWISIIQSQTRLFKYFSKKIFNHVFEYLVL
jgi:hypothetical protein